MDIDSIIVLVNQVGFPIVACAALFYMNVKTIEQQKLIVGRLEHSLDLNTKAIDHLCRHLEVDLHNEIRKFKNEANSDV